MPSVETSSGGDLLQMSNKLPAIMSTFGIVDPRIAGDITDPVRPRQVIAEVEHYHGSEITRDQLREDSYRPTGHVAAIKAAMIQMTQIGEIADAWESGYISARDAVTAVRNVVPDQLLAMIAAEIAMYKDWDGKGMRRTSAIATLDKIEQHLS
jgi:hypothetical protein